MIQYDANGLRGILNDLPTAKLEQMLEDELQKEKTDPAAVKLILTVLEERHAELPRSESAISEEARQKYRERMEKLFPPSSRKPWLPLVRAASVVLVIGLLFFTVIPQQAEAETFWEMLQRWSHTVIEFFGRGDRFGGIEYTFKTDNADLQQVHDAVTALGATEPVVPTWLPDGYELVELELCNTPVLQGVWAVFSLDDSEIFYQMNVYDGEPAHQYYRDDSHYESYELEGTTYNITQNNDRWVAVWMKDNIECSIFIDCQQETLRRILKSIYVMEE